MSVSVSVSVDVEKKLGEVAFGICGRSAKLLAVGLSKDVRNVLSSHTLSDYGVQNAQKVPHKWKAARGTILRSVTVVKSKKYEDSWLVNVRDWRARFLEGGAKPHRMPKGNRTLTQNGKKTHAFLGRNGKIITAKVIKHPGMQGVGFLKAASEPSNVERRLQEVYEKVKP